MPILWTPLAGYFKKLSDMAKPMLEETFSEK